MPPRPDAEPLALEAADGTPLEAERCVPPGAWGAAVLAHPHPQHGGDMRALVVSVLFEALPTAGIAVLRFNFRGVGGSGGVHDGGKGERLDLAAAVDALAEMVPDVPLIAAGWSFGADVALAVDHPALAGWFAVAPPLAVAPAPGLAAGRDPRPAVLVVPEHDQLRPPDSAREATAGWVATTIEVVAGADHFLAGRTDRVVAACTGMLSALQAG
jgi:uncharacterized protein